RLRWSQRPAAECRRGGMSMDESTRQLLDACPLIDEATWLRHAAGFAAAFVAPPKRERRLDLLTRRPRRIRRDSHKLHSDLDRRTCRCVVSSRRLRSVCRCRCSDDTWPLLPSRIRLGWSQLEECPCKSQTVGPKLEPPTKG